MSVPNPSVVTIPGGIRVKATVDAPPALLNEVLDLQQILSRSLTIPNDSSIEAILSASLKASQAPNAGPSSHLAIRTIGRSESASASTLRTASGLRLLDFTARERRKLERAEQRARLKAARNRAATLSPSASPAPMSTDAEGFVVPHAFFSPPTHSLSDTSSRTATPLHGSTGISHRPHNDLRRSRPLSSTARTYALPHSLTQQNPSRASSASTLHPLSTTQRPEPVVRSSSVGADSMPALRRATRAAPTWLARTTHTPAMHTPRPQAPDAGVDVGVGTGTGMNVGREGWEWEEDAARSLHGDNPLHSDASAAEQAQSLDSVGLGREVTLIRPGFPTAGAGAAIGTQRSLADLVSQRRAYAGTPVRTAHAHAVAHVAEDMDTPSAPATHTTQATAAPDHTAAANTAVATASASASASASSTTTTATADMSASAITHALSHTHTRAHTDTIVTMHATTDVGITAASTGIIATPSTPPRAPLPAPGTPPRAATAPPPVPTPPPRRRTSRGALPVENPSVPAAGESGGEDVGLDSRREDVDAAYRSKPACGGSDAAQRSRGRSRSSLGSPRSLKDASSYGDAADTRHTPSALSARPYAAPRTPHTASKAPYAVSRTGTPSSSRSLVQALEESVLAAADCHCRHRCVCGTTPCRCARICVCAIITASVGAPHSRAPSPMGTPLRQRAPLSAQSLPRPASSLVRNPYHARANTRAPSASASASTFASVSASASASARPTQLHMADSYHLLQAEAMRDDGYVVRADMMEVGVRVGRGGAMIGRSHSYALSTHSHAPSHTQRYSQPHAQVQDTPTATPDMPRVLRQPSAPLPPHYRAAHAGPHAYPYPGHDELSEDGYGHAAYGDAADAGVGQSHGETVRHGVCAEVDVSEGVVEAGRVAPIAWTPLLTASAPNTIYSVHALYQQHAPQRPQHRRHSSGGDSGGDTALLDGNGDGAGAAASAVYDDHETYVDSHGLHVDVAGGVAEHACVDGNVAVCGDLLGSARVSPPPLRAVASNGLMDLSNPLLLGGRTLSGHLHSYNSEDEAARDTTSYVAAVPRRVDVMAESPLVLRDTLPRTAGSFKPARTALPPPMPTPGRNSRDFPPHGDMSEAVDAATCARAALAWGGDDHEGMGAQLAPLPSQPPTPASQIGKNVVYIPPGFDISRFRDPFSASTGMEKGKALANDGTSVDVSAPSLDAHTPTPAEIDPQTPSLAALPLMPSFTPSLAVHDASLALDAAELMITPLVARRPDAAKAAVQPRRGIVRAHRSAPSSPATGRKGSQGATENSHAGAAATTSGIGADMPAGAGRGGHLGTLHAAVAKVSVGDSGATVLPSPMSLVHAAGDPLSVPADAQGAVVGDDALVTPTATPLTTAAARRVPGAPIHPGGGLRGPTEDVDAAFGAKELYVTTEDALEGPTARGPVLITPGSTPVATPQIPVERLLRGPPALPRPPAPSAATNGSAMPSGRRVSVNPPTPLPGRPLRSAVTAGPVAPNAIVDAELARRELKSLLARCLAAFLSADNPLYLEVFAKSYKRVRKQPECCRMWGREDVSALLQPWAVEATIAEISSVFPQLSRESILTSIERKIMVPTRKRKSSSNVLASTAVPSGGYRMNGYYGNEQPQKVPRTSRNSVNSENPRAVSRSYRLPTLPSRSPSDKDKHPAL